MGDDRRGQLNMNNKMLGMATFSFGLLALVLVLFFMDRPARAMVEREAPAVPHFWRPTPASSSPVLLLDATTLTLTQGAIVTIWNGQTAIGSPIFQTNQTPNGQPAVAFDGSAHMGENVPIPVGPDDDFVIAAVIKPAIINAYRNLIDDDASVRPMLWLDTGSRYELNFGTTAVAGNGPDGWDIVIADSKQGVVYLNDPTNPLPASAVSYATAKTFDLFNRDGGQMYAGLVAEFRVYTDKAGFGNDLQALYDELYDKYIDIGESPVNNLPGAQIVDEDTPLPINTLSVSDSDGNLMTTQLSVGQGTLSVTLTGTAVISAGANGSSGLTVAGNQADINATLATLSYQGDLHFNGSDVLTVVSTDDTLLSTTDTVTITVNPVNDPPVNSVPGAQVVDEDMLLSISSINTTDVDGNLASTQMSVFNGTIIVTLSGSATISTGSNGSSTLTISGTENDINATLATLAYQGNLNFWGSDVLTVVSTDSAGIPLSDTDTVAITVNPINDAPVNSVPGSQTAAADTPLAISTIGVTDVDGNLSTTQISVMNGFINIVLAGNATISAGNNGSSSLTLAGSEAAINATLASLIYQGNLNFKGCDVLAVTSTDSAGTPLQDVDTVTIKVDPPDLAIAPVITLTNGGGTQAQLDWVPNAANCTYKIYRSIEPYNNYSLAATLPAGSATYLADLGTIGNSTTNYFFYVAGINSDATHSAASNHNGAFDFALVPGEG